MHWTQAVDLYCERTDPSFWSEPLNALSNVAFLLAAGFVLRVARRTAEGPAWDAVAFAALIALVAAGSFLFHTLATVWAEWLDVLFILVFIYVFLARFLARVAGLRWRGVAVGLVAYGLASKALTAPFAPGSFSGSYSYLPPLLALTGLAWFARRRADAGAKRLALAALAFAISLALRTVDLGWCDAWPPGTHFVWHCLNALVLYLAATALLGERLPPAAQAA